jgi:hypothetical protein
VFGGASERERERESVSPFFVCASLPDCSTRLVRFFCSVADAAVRV